MSLLTVREVVKRFGGVTAVNRCSLEVEPQRIFGLIGPNGSGKTTLFNCITGLLHLDGGEISFKGERINGLRPYQVCQKGIGRTFQITRIFPELTALENLMVVARDGEARQSAEKAVELLDFVGLLPLCDEYAGTLSFGQQKLLEFVRVLMTDPELILLDEPAAGVNPTLLARLLEHIASLRDRGKTVLIVEHNMDVIMSLCEWIFVLDHGEKIVEGTPREIRDNEQVIEAYFGRKSRSRG